MSNPVEHTVDLGGRSESGATRRFRDLYRRKLILACGILLAIAASVGGWWCWSIESGLTRARQAAQDRNWPAARRNLTRYLRWHQNDDEAHLLMAEAFVRDDTGESPEFVPLAIDHLGCIDADSPLAAEARLRESRLTLLIRLQPARAERLLEESLRLDPDSLEANLLMWKLLDLTGRHVASRRFFWRVYELSSESERPLRLRDWYFSEFYPDTANAPFYTVLNVEEFTGIPPSVNLLVRFRENEPEATFVHAALAAYYLEQGRPTSSLDLLKEAPDLRRAMEDPYFVAVLFESLLDLGEFDKARTCFEEFPPPHSGYLYRSCEGMHRQHVLDDAAAAVESYREALADPSAKFDWGLMMELSECLRATGRTAEAESVRSRVTYLTRHVLTREKTGRLRNALRNVNDPDVARELRDLYSEFALSEEADAWEAHRQELLQSALVGGSLSIRELY